MVLSLLHYGKVQLHVRIFKSQNNRLALSLNDLFVSNNLEDRFLGFYLASPLFLDFSAFRKRGTLNGALICSFFSLLEILMVVSFLLC